MIHHGEKGVNFTVRIKTRKKKWETVIHKMPYQEKWWHLLITWNKQSGLSLFINGNFAVQKGYAEDISKDGREADSSLAPEVDDIVIGCTNRTTEFIRSLKEFGQFDFGHLAIWSRVLSQEDIAKAYKASIIETKKSVACCKRMEGNTLDYA